MKCLNNELETRGKIIQMSRYNNRQNKKNIEDNQVVNKKITNDQIYDKLTELEKSLTKAKSNIDWIIKIGTVLASALVSISFMMYNQINDMDKKISENTNNITNIEKSLTKIDEIVEGSLGNEVLNNKLDSLSENINSLENRLIRLEDRVNTIDHNIGNFNIINTSSEVISYINNAATIEPNETNVVTSSLNNNTVLGINSKGKECIAEDLINETVLYTYTENNVEVYFLGQFNENYNWDGFCITNAYYNDGKLMGICESDFKDGERLNFKSFVEDKDKLGNWIYSDKICDKNNSFGINKSYILNYDKIKDFSFDTVNINNIVYVNDFIDKNAPTIKTFYYGNTVNSLYNDNSGNAYYISFNDNGTVKTLYQGNFSDGYFNDDTGNAWYITKNVDTSYLYFKGIFENGKAIEDKKHKFQNLINLSEINEIIKNKKFDCDLKWDTN